MCHVAVADAESLKQTQNTDVNKASKTPTYNAAGADAMDLGVPRETGAQELQHARLALGRPGSFGSPGSRGRAGLAAHTRR